MILRRWNEDGDRRPSVLNRKPGGRWRLDGNPAVHCGGRIIDRRLHGRL